MRTPSRRALLLLALAGVAGLAAVAPAASPATAAPATLVPFTHVDARDWLNSAPLSAAGLRGRPVLVEFWAFACSNCLASLPWMQAISARYAGRGLQIVAVHTPELPDEYDRAAVGRAVERHGIRYPVMLDADYSYWRALDNRYWPAFYLYDAAGRAVAAHIGELHRGEPRSDAFERLIEAALPGAVP